MIGANKRKYVKFNETFKRTINGVEMKITPLNGYTATIKFKNQVRFANSPTNERQIDNNTILYKYNKGNAVKTNGITLDLNFYRPFIYFHNVGNIVIIDNE